LPTLQEIATQVAGTVRGDATVAIDGIGAIDDAAAGSLTFAVDERYLRAALRSRAAAVLTEPEIAERVGAARKPLLLVPSARVALAALLAALEPPRPRAPYRHPSAAVAADAVIGPDVHVGPFVSVGAGAVVGAETVLLAGSVVGEHARLGRNCTLHPRAMLLDRCVAGDGVTLQAGAIVGSDGFGYAFLDGRFVKIPQVGNVVLGNDVEIGANTCIDRAQTGTTAIGDGTKIDNLVQIGHNCRIGKNCGIVSMVGIAGSSTVGDYTVIGGQTGVNGHITIGSRVKIAGGTDVWSDLPDDAFVSGRPARDHREELKAQVRLRNLEKLFERVTALEQR